MNQYTFSNPGKIQIRTRLANQKSFVETSSEVWTWNDAGDPYSIDWTSFTICDQLRHILKGFISHRFQSRSPQTVIGDKAMIQSISQSKLSNYLPWDKKDVVDFLNSIKAKVFFSSFKKFYQWAYRQEIDGFTSEMFFELEEIKANKRSQYHSVYFQEAALTPEEESALLDWIDDYVEDEYESLRDSVILQLGFELGPRPTQLYPLNNSDLEIFSLSNQETTKRYTLWLPTAKKISSKSMQDKRALSISSKLGSKMELLIKKNQNDFRGSGSDSEDALFKNENGARLSAGEITSIVVDELTNIGCEKGEGLKLLRHHVAQSLADVGAPAETIAEILGHNSTLPARAYISAAPEIAVIKSKALGKNDTYLNIMKMMLTGKIIKKREAPKERWVQGIVGLQYIGGIGACGLNQNTPCPKNPVYSCYTCNKFHPFVDGMHQSVKEALQNHAQFFVDTAATAMQLENNRAVIQLERTITAVDSVIHHCKSRNTKANE